ncbi:MAG: PEGA domain-containing protein, partial [Lachnospiraceae bacterium]|nr:PEGA domain-containing protein [Lachnospiraceae bacterium]
NNNNNSDIIQGNVPGHNVYVDTPAGARLYVDGNYVGFVPASFEKVRGIHTITLAREGYKTISYNIELDAAPTDKTFRFGDLIPQ